MAVEWERLHGSAYRSAPHNLREARRTTDTSESRRDRLQQPRCCHDQRPARPYALAGKPETELSGIRRPLGAMKNPVIVPAPVFTE